MIKSEPIKDLIILRLECSVLIDLNTLEIVHKKLTYSGYDEVEYEFSVHHTNYFCNEISEIHEILVTNGVSEISKLNIRAKNKNYKGVFINIEKNFGYYLNIHSSDSESNHLMKEIFSILEENNTYGYKLIASKAVNYQGIIWATLCGIVLLVSQIYKIPGVWENYGIFFCYVTIILIAVLIFSYTQKVRIFVRKETSTRSNYGIIY